MGRIVIAAYRPKEGAREALRRLIVQHVATLRSEGLVTDREPITMEAEDGTVVEVFEWKSTAAIEAAHANAAVLAMWDQYNEVCEYVPIAQVPEAARLFSEFTPVAGAKHELPRRHPKARAKPRSTKRPGRRKPVGESTARRRARR
jgi:quinol monooxygenase YgiN